ncbi:MAG: hypothetical protein ACRC2T_11770 [Thermoguttaceae bacterium]
MSSQPPQQPPKGVQLAEQQNLAPEPRKPASKKERAKKLRLEEILKFAEESREKINSILQTCQDLQKNFPAIESKHTEFQQLVDTHKKTIESAVTAIKSSQTDCENKYQDIEAYRQEIHDCRGEILGYTDDAGVPVVGLKSELESAFEELETKFESTRKQFSEFQKSKESAFTQFLDEKEQEYQAIEAKIESLLPGALSAGLSSAYQSKRESIGLERIWHYRVFFFSLCVIFGWAVYCVIFAPKDVTDTTAGILYFVRCFVVTIPILWLAIFSSKKINLTGRLIEEYSHKETVSKTFEGLSKEIQKDDDEKSNALRKRLLEILLETNSENPGKLVKGYDTSDHPIAELTSLLNSVNGLKKLPGFDMPSVLSVIAAALGVNIASSQITSMSEEGKDTATTPS